MSFTQASRHNYIVIILGYKRYNNIISICNVLRPTSDFIVCLDGLPPNASENDKLIRQDFLELCSKQSISVSLRTYNMGSKLGIPDFLVKFSKGFDYFIAIEDDLKINPNTIDFFEKNMTFLDTTPFYANAGTKIGMLSAFTCFSLNNDNEFHLSWTGPSWCWATSSSFFDDFVRWRSRLLLKEFHWSEIDSKLILKKIPILSRNRFKYLFKQLINGERSNWDLSFRLYSLLNARMTLRSNCPLVHNTGFDGVSQNHLRKSILHNDIRSIPSFKPCVLSISMPPLLLDFFQPWMPRRFKMLNKLIFLLYFFRLHCLLNFVRNSID